MASSASTFSRAGVLGDPIDHSLSPVVHTAAYRALGLSGWTYDRILCSEQDLPHVVSHADAAFVGFSVTMPCKFAALSFATSYSDRSQLIGSANTLVRQGEVWFADNTDVDGVRGTLNALGISRPQGKQPRSALILGAGGTARPALLALAQTGFTTVAIASRSLERSQDALQCGRDCGLDMTWISIADSSVIKSWSDGVAVLINTLPGHVADAIAPFCQQSPVLIDVVYHPWPTLIAQGVAAHGGAVAGGLSMLLFQAFGQVEEFTGCTLDSSVRLAMAKSLGLDSSGLSS